MGSQKLFKAGTNHLPHSLVGRILHHAQTTPTHTAIVSTQVELSYKQLASILRQQVAALKAHGINSDTVVGIQCDDDIGHLLLCLAATGIGATSCTIPSYETAESNQSLIDKSGVTAILDQSSVIDIAHTNDLADLSEELADNACLLFSTSGSTGEPKLVMHQDNDLVAQAHRHIDSSAERFACRASIEHNFAKRHRLYCLAMGATNVFLNQSLDSAVEECLSLSVNVLHVSAFQAQELLQLAKVKHLSNIRLKLGGSHVPLPLREALRNNITPTLQAGYGTTETGAIAFTQPDDHDAGESVGQPLSGIHIQCVDADKKPVETGERGEVAIKCAGLFRGYLNHPELSAKRIVNGWFYTGDIAYLDKQNRIHLCGRADDMFTFNSMNIYPQELESVIRQYPGVKDALVLPKPSDVHGNIPVALVVFNPTMKLDLPALKKFVQQHAGVRSPRHYTFVDKIPTKKSGKASRLDAIKLTEKSDNIRQALVGLLGDETVASVSPKQIKAFIKGDKDLSLRKLNMDSLARVNLLVGIELTYDIVIAPHTLGQLRTLGKLAARLLTLMNTPEAQSGIEQDLQFDTSKCTAIDDAFVVRYMQRLISYCDTVTKLNQVLAKLDHRFTPLEIAQLDHALNKQIFTAKETEEKFQAALSNWLNETKRMMFYSGKKAPEPFNCTRLTPEISLFADEKSDQHKTLLMVFPPRGIKQMMMSNAIWLQHIDSTQYDVLMVANTDQASWLTGKVSFSKKLHQLVQWLTAQAWFAEYKHIRTVGYSAGTIPAMIMAHALGADLGLCISGRLSSKKRFIVNYEKISAVKQAVKRGQCQQILLSYSANNKRDKKFAKYFAKLTQGQTLPVEIQGETLSHLILRRLAERGELAAYLAKTLFKEVDAKAADHTARSQTKITFP